MELRNRIGLATLGIVFLGAAIKAQAQGCIVFEGENRQISVSASGVSIDVSVYHYKSRDASEDTPSCSATAFVKLSSFPSSRLATRPSQIAAALREAVEEFGTNECVVRVYYENDTEEEFAEHEQCLMETFKFDRGAYWSSSSEGHCWPASEGTEAA